MNSHDDFLLEASNITDAFKSETIKKFSEHSLPSSFIQTIRWDDHISIYVDDIVGTQHPDYIGLTWEELLHQGKRMHINIPLVIKNPQYYWDSGKKLPTMSYNRYEGKYYVAGDGNHRSAIAKFIFAINGNTKMTLDGISTTEYTADVEAYNLFERIKASAANKHLPLVFKSEKTLVSRDDAPGWKVDYFKTEVSVRNSESGKNVSFEINQKNMESLRELLLAIENRLFFSKWVSSNKYAALVG